MPKQPLCQEVLVILNPNVSSATLSLFSLVWTLETKYDVSTVKTKQKKPMIQLYFSNTMIINLFLQQFLGGLWNQTFKVAVGQRGQEEENLPVGKITMNKCPI